MSNRQGSRFDQLLQSLQDENDDALTCPEAVALLPEYQQAVWMGCQGQSRWADVARHLHGCPSCAEAYALLDELEAFALGEEGEEPATYPQTVALDLRGATEHVEQAEFPFWRVDRWGRLVVELTEQALRGRYDLPSAGSAQQAVTLAEDNIAFDWQYDWRERRVRVQLMPSLNEAEHVDLIVRLALSTEAEASTSAGSWLTVSQGANVLAATAIDMNDTVHLTLPADALRQLRIEIDPTPGEDGV